jgi:hypothetical protein
LDLVLARNLAAGVLTFDLAPPHELPQVEHKAAYARQDAGFDLPMTAASKVAYIAVIMRNIDSTAAVVPTLSGPVAVPRRKGSQQVKAITSAERDPHALHTEQASREERPTV